MFRGEELLKGEVVKWIPLKGFGFIDIQGQNANVFVHNEELKNVQYLTVGDKVEFEIEKSNRGLKAVNVKLI